MLHKAGEELTDALYEAPHGVDLLERYPVIGIFGKTKTSLSGI